MTEEDSGLSLLGLFQLSEPDHYAVLLERARRRHRCERMHHAQLDFFTDHWLLVAFPISRMTLVCETGGPESRDAPGGESLPMASRPRGVVAPAAPEPVGTPQPAPIEPTLPPPPPADGGALP